MSEPQTPDFVLVSIVEYPDGRVVGTQLHRGSQKECEKAAALVPAIAVSEPVTRAGVRVIPAHQWDDLRSGAGEAND